VGNKELAGVVLGWAGLGCDKRIARRAHDAEPALATTEGRRRGCIDGKGIKLDRSEGCGKQGRAAVTPNRPSLSALRPR